METIGEDSIDLSRLEGGSLFEGKIRWPRQCVVQHVIVKLQLAINLEELSLAVLEQSLLQLLCVNISEFLDDVWIIDIDAIHAQFLHHVLILGDLHILVNIALTAL